MDLSINALAKRLKIDDTDLCIALAEEGLFEPALYEPTNKAFADGWVRMNDYHTPKSFVRRPLWALDRVTDLIARRPPQKREPFIRSHKDVPRRLSEGAEYILRSFGYFGDDKPITPTDTFGESYVISTLEHLWYGDLNPEIFADRDTSIAFIEDTFDSDILIIEMMKDSADVLCVDDLEYGLAIFRACHRWMTGWPEAAFPIVGDTTPEFVQIMNPGQRLVDPSPTIPTTIAFPRINLTDQELKLLRAGYTFTRLDMNRHLDFISIFDAMAAQRFPHICFPSAIRLIGSTIDEMAIISIVYDETTQETYCDTISVQFDGNILTWLTEPENPSPNLISEIDLMVESYLMDVYTDLPKMGFPIEMQGRYQLLLQLAAKRTESLFGIKPLHAVLLPGMRGSPPSSLRS